MDKQLTWTAKPGIFIRESELKINSTLRLRVCQTSLRSETSNRKFSLALYKITDRMRSCIWHMDDVICVDMPDAQRVALESCNRHFQTALKNTKVLADAVENAMLACNNPGDAETEDDSHG